MITKENDPKLIYPWKITSTTEMKIMNKYSAKFKVIQNIQQISRDLWKNQYLPV